MGFENHSRIGLVEMASRIALRFKVTYSVKHQVFEGDADRVAKATAALDRWKDSERLRNR